MDVGMGRVVENRDTQNLSYTFLNESDFFQVGYKVLQSQEKSGFIGCAKIIHNGKTKLVYDVSKYRTLDSLMPGMRPETFLMILANLFDVVIEVKGNGFLQCENIAVSFDKVFVDCNNYKVFLIYLPLNAGNTEEGYARFEQQLKSSIVSQAGRYGNLSDPRISRLCDELRTGVGGLEALRSQLAGGGFSAPGPESYAPYAAPSEGLPVKEESKPEPMPESRSYPKSNKTKTKRENSRTGLKTGISAGILLLTAAIVWAVFLLVEMPRQIQLIICAAVAVLDVLGIVLLWVFGFRKKSPEPKPRSEIDFRPESEGGATELLEDIFTPSLLLVGDHTPERVELLVDKPEYILGKSPETADGVLAFNKAISRVHCKILFSDGMYYVADSGSANGTYVNGKRLAAQQKVPLRSGDKLRLANSDFMVRTR